jgi:RND family efflux transporter MFP subunit
VRKSATQVWLSVQCAMIRGVTRGILVFAAPEGGAGAPAARWPDDAGACADLASAANAALTQRCAITDTRPAGTSTGPGPGAGSGLGCGRIALPFSLPGRAGAVAIELADFKESESQPIVDLLEFGITWLGALMREEAANERLVTVVELLGVAFEQGRFRAAATGVATDLAMRLDCERVSIGVERRGHVRVEALSHSASFDGKANLIRDLGLAMEEAYDQDATIVEPAPAGSTARITREHERLTGEHGAGAVCTVPTASGGRIAGAITFERGQQKTFDSETIRLCEDAASLLGPILELRRAADARLYERARELLHVGRTRLFGPGHPAFKLGTAIAVGILLLVTLAKGDYRVTAAATLEGRVQRAIVAGLDGYIAQASARAGDIVRRGQPLGRLDERDLLLERRKWQGRHEQLWKEYREALAAHDRTEVNITSARLGQAKAQLDLIEENLARTRLVAPFDGIVVRGDLSQSLGSPVERGDVLFEVAPLDGYRIILKVDERDIAEITAGQRGQLALSAMPGKTLQLTVERVTPVASAEDGHNYFRVEARLERPSHSLRPGMEGIAKIEVDRRRFLWIWTHGLFDWLRLWAWSWWP